MTNLHNALWEQRRHYQVLTHAAVRCDGVATRHPDMYFVNRTRGRVVDSVDDLAIHALHEVEVVVAKIVHRARRSRKVFRSLDLYHRELGSGWSCVDSCTFSERHRLLLIVARWLLI